VAKFPEMILHLYSIAADVGQFSENVFGPLLNHHSEFLTPTLAAGFARVLNAVYGAVGWPVITKIFLVGIYSPYSEVVDAFLRIICANELCNGIDERILEHHFEHFGNPQLLVSVLLRREKLSIACIPFLKQQLACNTGAVVLLCRFAESEEGAAELLRDLEWMECEEAVPIALVLMRVPDAEAAIVESPHFGKVERMLAACEDE
jgi:hypothetical protein